MTMHKGEGRNSVSPQYVGQMGCRTLQIAKSVDGVCERDGAVFA